MQRSDKGIARLLGSVCSISLLATLTLGAQVTSAGAEELPQSGSWTPCATDVEPCPASPSILSVTGGVDSLTVSWSWGDDAVVPDEITSVVVRVNEDENEIVVPRSDSSVVIEELDPETNYALSVYGVSVNRLSVPAVATESTLAEPSTGSPVVDAVMAKPQASLGNVERLIVTLGDDRLVEAQADDIGSDLPVSGVSVEDTQALGEGNALINLSEGVSDSDAALIIHQLSSDPRVKSVEVDGWVRSAVFPSDPPNDYYWASGDLWGLYGTYGIGLASGKTSMNPVWSAGQGLGSVVAVIDTGSTSHPDLDSQYVAGYDFVSNYSPITSGTYGRSSATSSDGDYIDTGTYGALGWDSNPSDPGDWANYDPSSWHGTHVAGTIAAQANNTIGVAGVAPLAKIQPIRALSFSGGTTSDIVAAITWASGGSISGVPSNATPADVINLSLGGYSPSGCSSYWQTAIDGAVGRGSVVVVSAGNSNDNAAYYSPANCDNVITVGASTSAGVRSSFSNYGNDVEISAPGSSILSTMNSGSTIPSTATYTMYSGTSMAAPHVSGIAALIKERDPTMTPANVLAQIQATSMSFPVTGSGFDCTTSTCGAGLAQASGAPVLTGLSSEAGPVAGGESVTISGSNLDTVTSVTFGGSVAALISQTFASAVVTTPSHVAGSVDIALIGSAGTTTWANSYDYHDPPTLTSIGTVSGSTSGGTTVTLTGTNLSGASQVSFGGVAGTISSSISTSVTVITPSHAAGLVNVDVETPGGTDSLTAAFTFVAPVAPPTSSGGGGSSGSSSSSSSSSSAESAGGAGGGLNEIVSIVPSASGSPGTVIALAGWGLSTTREVLFNDYEASWELINDGHVEVVVPDIPPGVYVIHAVLSPTVGRASYWDGFSVISGSSGSTASSSAPSDTSTGPSPDVPQVASRGDFVTFKGKSTSLTPSTQIRLNRIVQSAGAAVAMTTVTTFSDLRGSSSSRKIASARAKKIASYLQGQGLKGVISTSVERGSVAVQTKGALVRMTTSMNSNVASETNSVRSLIVRYAKSVTPSVNGKVVGSSKITGGLSAGMTLGPNLGLRMYRVDFSQPVTVEQAQRAAIEMSKDKKIEFAEVDSFVTAQITKN